MINRLLALAGVLAIAAPLAIAQTSTWVPDKAHSEVNFSILHMSLANVRGRFGDIGGTVALDQSNITKSTANITIDVSTVDTGVAARDADLKSPHFFDAAKYPTATFVSTSFKKNESDGLIVTGNLTLHGVTRPVVLQAEGPTGPVNGPGNKQHRGFSATATINRKDFGIGPSYPNAAIGDQVKLTIDLDLVKQ